MVPVSAIRSQYGRHYSQVGWHIAKAKRMTVAYRRHRTHIIDHCHRCFRPGFGWL